SAFSSVASIAMIPMQDFLALGSDARFNTPGTVANNWVWQLDWAHCPMSITEKIADAVQRHDRD
ncbi:MAG TPA: 4-alpha-glucanotransferase, partial [Cellvibrionaceae bacterium]